MLVISAQAVQLCLGKAALFNLDAWVSTEDRIEGMQRQEWLDLLKQQRVLAVIRAPSQEAGYQMATAVRQGGLRLIEITWNTPQAAALVERLRCDLGDCWIGAGTLLTEAALKDAIAAGAQFGFSPHTNAHLIQLAQNQALPFVPGALTPTEIALAWHSGASGVKVFPINAAGGATYLNSLRGPLGHIPLIPTGGVRMENASELLQAGAIAIGLSSSLFPPQLIKSQHWGIVSERVRQLLQTIQPFMG